MADDTLNMQTIDLSAYADPMVEGIQLRAASRGDSALLEAIKAELHREQDRGWCRILLMSDELAVVQWIDQFVLTIKDESLATPVREGA